MSSRASIVIIGFLLIGSSCATVINPRTGELRIRSEKPIVVIYNGDTIPVTRKIRLIYQRSGGPLTFAIRHNDSIKTYTQSASKSSAYYLNSFSPLYLGFLVDMNSPKRFRYRPIDIDNTYQPILSVNGRKAWIPPSKGTINMHLSIPEVNNLRIKPDGHKAKNTTGFLGIMGGVDYYYSNNQFVSVSAGVATDFPVFVPAPIDYVGPHEDAFTSFVALTNNHAIKRFSIGYGLTYARNGWTWKTGIFGPEPAQTIIRRNNSAGFILNTYYRIAGSFHIGLIYRPTFVRFETENPFDYEHLVSLDLAWKIRLRK